MNLLLLILSSDLFVLPLAVAAGTLLYCSIDWEKTLFLSGLASSPSLSDPSL
jgi:hypothetical protein